MGIAPTWGFAISMFLLGVSVGIAGVNITLDQPNLAYIIAQAIAYVSGSALGLWDHRTRKRERTASAERLRELQQQYNEHMNARIRSD